MSSPQQDCNQIKNSSLLRVYSNYRSKLALAAAFVDATDSRYGFSSKDLRKLGGSEVSRIHDLISSDHGKSKWHCE